MLLLLVGGVDFLLLNKFSGPPFLLLRSVFVFVVFLVDSLLLTFLGLGSIHFISLCPFSSVIVFVVSSTNLFTDEFVGSPFIAIVGVVNGV